MQKGNTMLDPWIRPAARTTRLGAFSLTHCNQFPEHKCPFKVQAGIATHADHLCILAHVVGLQ